MRALVQKWGNSLGLRIPKSFAREAGIENGGAVELTIEDGRLVIAPVTEAEYDLDVLLAKVTPESIHGEVDFGRPVGKEVW